MNKLSFLNFKKLAIRKEYSCVYGSNTIEWDWLETNVYIEKQGNKINCNKLNPYCVRIRTEGYHFRTLSEAMDKAYMIYLNDEYKKVV